MKRTSIVHTVFKPVLSAVAFFGVLYVTASYVRPVFVGRTTVAQRVLASPAVRDSAGQMKVVVSRSPWLHAPFESAITTRQFASDRAAFVADLLRTGRLSPDRANRIAETAVTRAYRERIPPALVLGVMLTENDGFKPRARSRVGAVGLMQIMPRVWRPTLGKIFGTDLSDDATNVKYGVFILRWTHDGVPEEMSPIASYRTALLRYNGCVQDLNAASCRRYPDTVRRYVLRNGRATCGNLDFEACVVQPLWLRRQIPAPARVALSTPPGRHGAVME